MTGRCVRRRPTAKRTTNAPVLVILSIFADANPCFAWREESYTGKQGTLSDREAMFHVIPKDSSLPRETGIPLRGTVQNDKWGRFPLTPTVSESARFSFPLIRASARPTFSFLSF